MVYSHRNTKEDYSMNNISAQTIQTAAQTVAKFNPAKAVNVNAVLKEVGHIDLSAPKSMELAGKALDAIV